ncbi:MAG: bidirectional hydrogenase complex protein HoxE [Oscillatoria sp. PMC 1051.18]|nr:bidirectional hydrogenase complex protein HoxE [Oscillatoria sp. PMC 1050.18]MEC5030548.1 bidirectional hydrogenase complex protein HoxE [Oscillatoria sp. PMC 1051.18]
MQTSQKPPKLVRKPPPQDNPFKRIDIALKRNHYQPDALIEILHAAQNTFGYLEADTLAYIAKNLKLPLSRVYGVATFYHLFTLKPGGKHTCVVCLGTACYVKGSQKVLAALEQQTKIQAGETTSDGQISLLTARCIGACGIAPAVVFDGQVAGQVSPAAALAKVEGWSTPG